MERARQTRWPRRLRLLGITLTLFVLWPVAGLLPITLESSYGALAVPVLLAAFYAVQLRPAAPRTRATLRLRAPELPAGTLAALVVASGAVAIGMAAVRPLLAGDVPDAGHEDSGIVNPATLMALAVGFAPLVEEVAFRGWLQRPLERRWGTRWALAGSATGFSLVHFDAALLPGYLFVGWVFGAAVVRARSLWAGVLMHTGHNSALVLGELTLGSTSAIPPLVGLGLMALAGGAALWLLRGATGGSGRRAPAHPRSVAL